MHEIWTSETESGDTIDRLRVLANKHNACYEVWPYIVFANGRQVKVGFEVELCGTNEDGASLLCPGCQQCKATFADLRQIAEAVIPGQGEMLRCEVRPYDAAVHQSPRRGFRPEVVLCITMLQRNGFDQQVDRSGEDCMKQICGRLTRLGVRSSS